MLMIRSQNRELLYPLNHGLYVSIEKHGIENKKFKIRMDMGLPINEDSGIPLGEYVSKSRCLEILDEIQNEFQYSNHFSGSGVNTYSCQNSNYGVYQMPKK